MSWDALSKRRAPIVLQPELSRYSDGIDIQSPDLEWAATQHVNILMLNGTKVDCVSLDQAPKARSDVDDVRIWHGSQWGKLNDNRKLDKAFGRGLVKYGVAVGRLFWDQADGDEASESDAEEAAEIDFRFEHVNPLEVAWWPLKDPEIVIQEGTVKWIEARDFQDSSGQFLSLDAANKLVFVGEREPLAQWNSFAGRVPELRLVTRAAKDLDTGEWTLCEYIYPGSADGKTNLDAGQQLSECVVPMMRCPYFIIPGAGEDQYEQDPHLRYRPMMYRLYVYVQEYNFWRTVLSAMARKYSGDNVVYLDLSSVKPDAVPILENVFPTEGSGATRKLTFQLPEPGSGELTVSPAKIERWPAEIEAHALAMFEECKKLIADAMPNRFMTGEAFGEVRDGTGTAVINMTEAARIPYSAELTMIDGGIKNILQGLEDCILYYDKGTKVEIEYPVVVSGLEPLARTPGEPGTQVFVTASKIRRPHQIIVTTRNLTQAEESQEALMAYQDFAQGVITFEQLLERRGHNDPIKQLEDLERDRARKMQEPHTDQLLLQSLSVLFTAMSGVNTAAILGLNLPQPPQPQGQPAGGQPFEMVPNRQPGGQPQWRPGSMATQMPPMETRGGQAQARPTRPGPAAGRPAITPAPLTPPAGGSSPMAGVP